MKTKFQFPIFLIIVSLIISCNPESGFLKNPANYELYISISCDKTAAVSPNGKLIAYYHQELEYPGDENYPTGLYVIDIDGANRKLLLKGNHWDPDWSPDSNWIVFTSSGVLQIINLEGDSLKTFQGVNDVPLYHPDWSQDGSSIIFSSPFVDGGGIFTCDPSFQNVKQLLNHYESSGSDPCWSPDGKKILYSKYHVNNRELFFVDTTAMQESRLTENDRSDNSPTWSQNGNLISWSSDVQIYIMDSLGNNEYRLDYGSSPSFTKDSKHIIYSFANEDYTKEVLYKIDITTKEKVQITF